MDRAVISNCVLLLNLPPAALAGIDLLSFTSSPRFRGIKSVPPGLHFVFAAGDAALSVRHGAWFYVTPGQGAPQVFVKRWDAGAEELVAETAQAEVLRWRANLGSIWREGLTPYRQSVAEGDSGKDEDGWAEESEAWGRLTSRVSQTLLSRICGLNPDHWSLTSASCAAQDVERIPGLETDALTLFPEKELGFLPIDLKRTWRVGATGRERTDAAQDRSWFLGDVIAKHCHATDARGREYEVIGELQFAFLMVLTLNNNSCLEQWKRILQLLFTCRSAVQERVQLFTELLRVLRWQLGHCKDLEAGLFDMHDVGGGFLKPLVMRFQRSLGESTGKWKAELVTELDALQEQLQKDFGWEPDGTFVTRGMLDLEDGERVEMDVNGADADDELGEFAPVVVDLTPAQLAHVNRKQDGSSSGAETDEDEAELEDMDTRY